MIGSGPVPGTSVPRTETPLVSIIGAASTLADPALERLGPLLTRHPRFAEGANAGSSAN